MRIMLAATRSAPRPQTSRPDPRIAAFDRFVRSGAHPCVMAHSVLTRRNVSYGTYGQLGDPGEAAALCRDLYAASALPRARDANWSFVAFFDTPVGLDEAGFERGLWRQLQVMHDYDARRYDWDPRVAADPADPKFSFSIGGRAWYVIGLHPRASREARRFGSLALVFNPHSQFDRLRTQGKYAMVKGRIRERDVALQGSVNPMLADHGEMSEARQYSGRAVPGDWACPFRAGREPGSH
jgi:FPC/CPF motif-containing protein YcgG